MKFILASVAAFAIASLVAGESINVTIHYRSYCIHCQAFSREQLYPTFNLLGDEILNVELIPNSIATYDDAGNLAPTCYSGENECVAEQYQSCVWVRNYTQAQKILFWACVAATDDSSIAENIQSCIETAEMEWDEISECYQNGDGYKHLIEFNEIQHSYDKEIDHVPFIMYNGVVDYDIETAARAAFLETTCSYLNEKPSSCPTDD
ncbi:hypothetical protein NQ318_019229 [Aromia moschata]|uniref:Uncharacterized protein n=1 Tax=Aromia moschata TaxID=1265417 RepID=A0AAV8YXY4_9CUCU|nr:hypothetical protein NQ318_019229 [Aromia moschata]